jgi:YVTN family beta-propeller protein
MDEGGRAQRPSGRLPPAEPAPPGSDRNSSAGTAGAVLVCKVDSFVEFYDPKTLARTGEIRLPDHPHEVVLSPDRRRAYVSIYGNGIVGTNTEPGTRIAIIDLAKQRLDGFIEVTPYLGPHGMMFDRAGNLWATAEMSNTLIVIDPKRGVVVGSVPIGSHRTHWLAVTPDGTKIYAPHRQLNWVSVIDVARRAVVTKIPNFIYECQGIAIAPDGNRIYQASSARPLVSVIDPKTDTVVGEIMVDGMGDFPPQHTRLKLSPDNKTLVVTYNLARKAALLDTEDLGSQRILPLEKGPMGIAFPDQGDTAFVTNHDEGSVTLLDLKSKKVAGRFATKMGPETLAFF